MKYAHKIGVLLVIIVLSGTPLLACMLPGAVTTEEEAACCREMASDCDHGSMPSSHSCCKTLSVPDQAAVAKLPFKLLHQFGSLYLVQPDFESALGGIGVLGRIVSTGHSPPESPPSSSEILRI